MNRPLVIAQIHLAERAIELAANRATVDIDPTDKLVEARQILNDALNYAAGIKWGSKRLVEATPPVVVNDGACGDNMTDGEPIREIQA